MKKLKTKVFVELYIKKDFFDLDEKWLKAIEGFGTCFTFLIPWTTSVPQIGSILYSGELHPLIEKLTVREVQYWHSKSKGYQIHIMVDFPEDRDVKFNEHGLVCLAEEGALCEDETTSLKKLLKKSGLLKALKENERT